MFPEEKEMTLTKVAMATKVWPPAGVLQLVLTGGRKVSLEGSDLLSEAQANTPSSIQLNTAVHPGDDRRVPLHVIKGLPVHSFTSERSTTTGRWYLETSVIERRNQLTVMLLCIYELSDSTEGESSSKIAAETQFTQVIWTNVCMHCSNLVAVRRCQQPDCSSTFQPHVWVF